MAIALVEPLIKTLFLAKTLAIAIFLSLLLPVIQDHPKSTQM
jgi:hypothetical protein